MASIMYPPIPAPIISPTQFCELIRRAEAALERILNTVNEFCDLVRRAISRLSGVIGDWVEDRLVDFNAKLNELIARTREWIENAGQPDVLSAAAMTFNEEIRPEVGGQANIFTPNGLYASDDKWQGDGARAYRRALAPQKDALEGYAETARAITLALNDCAWTIRIFLVGVCGALMVLGGGLLAAFWSAAPGLVAAFVAPPVLPAAVIAAVLAALGSMTAALAAAAATILACLTTARKAMSQNAVIFHTQATDNTPYGGDGWPHAGRDLRTGEVRY